MIKLIVTIDGARGMDGEWDLPRVEAYQNKKLATSDLQPLRRAFDRESDIQPFFHINRSVWVAGTSKLYEQAMPYADQLFITQINGIYNCDIFFPKFEDKFVPIKRSRIFLENGFEYQHQIWVKRELAYTQDARDTDTGRI